MTYGTSASYTYNAEGIRKSKTVNGATTTFNLVGSTILSQTKGSQTLVFLYDGNGSLIGFKDKSTDKDYFYLKNLQGDIVKIIDTNKTFVATYEYDDWGKLTTSESSLTAVGQLNPFRYRGYYYDTESSLYYLNSRYYDPETGRFVNADDVGLLGANGDFAGYNLFNYCGNNPIARKDGNGFFWNYVVGAVVGAAISAITTAIDIAEKEGASAFSSKNAWIKVGVSAVCGAINGAVAASGAHYLTGGTIGAVTGGIESLAHECIDTNRNMKKENWVAVGMDTLTGFFGGLAGGNVL